MGRDVIYYLGRIQKTGPNAAQRLKASILEPKPAQFYGYSWCFFDTKEHQHETGDFITGKLSKYDPEASLTISDPDSLTENVYHTPNRREASSHFIYIPRLSIIAFTKDPSGLNEYQFGNRFKLIVNTTNEIGLLDLSIELIADLKQFVEKLKDLNSITRISSSVTPSNPLFSWVWATLDRQMKERSAKRMTIIESAQDGSFLKTPLKELVEKSIQNPDGRPEDISSGEKNESIGGSTADKALLMAADGYGKGLVRGLKDGEEISITTKDTTLILSFPQEPTELELYTHVVDLVQQIENERGHIHQDT